MPSERLFAPDPGSAPSRRAVRFGIRGPSGSASICVLRARPSRAHERGRTVEPAMPSPTHRLRLWCSANGTLEKKRCGAAICNRLMPLIFSS